MDEEDTSRLVPESAANLWKIVREKTDLQRFGSGIKITCICLALVIIISFIHGIKCIYNDKIFCRFKTTTSCQLCNSRF